MRAFNIDAITDPMTKAVSRGRYIVNSSSRNFAMNAETNDQRRRDHSDVTGVDGKQLSRESSLNKRRSSFVFLLQNSAAPRRDSNEDSDFTEDEEDDDDAFSDGEFVCLCLRVSSNVHNRLRALRGITEIDA